MTSTNRSGAADEAVCDAAHIPQDGLHQRQVDASGHGVPIVHYEIGDLQDDLSTLAKLEAGRAAGA